jgi:hypothetical protein
MKKISNNKLILKVAAAALLLAAWVSARSLQATLRQTAHPSF